MVANEIEPYACETLRANKVLCSLQPAEFQSWIARQLEQRCYKGVAPEEVSTLTKRLSKGVGMHNYLNSAVIIEKDIRALTSLELLEASSAQRGSIDLVVGGPPCQPFSRAGKRENVECETGRLFQEFVRIVDDTRPRWFLFENVKGLVITHADVLDVRCHHCHKTSVAPFSGRTGEIPEDHLPCPRCGSFDTEPSWRKARGGSLEIILNEFEGIGYKCYWTVLNAADFGAPQMRERLFIVGSRDHEGFDWPNPTHQKPTAETSSKQPELFRLEATAAANWITMYEALWSKGHFKYGTLDRSKALLWVKNVVRPHAEPVTWRLDRPSPTIGAHQAAKLALAPDGVPDEQLARQQWHVLGRRQKDLPYVFVEHEYLSDEELIELQTFPSAWYLFGTRMQRAFQIGNAVPPILGEAVGRELLKVCTPHLAVERQQRRESNQTT